MLPQIPVKFARAARDLLAGRHVEEPIVNEPSPQAYKGTGTMFRYSGSFSMIEHQPSLDLLAAGLILFGPVSCLVLMANRTR